MKITKFTSLAQTFSWELHEYSCIEHLIQHPYMSNKLFKCNISKNKFLIFPFRIACNILP